MKIKAILLGLCLMAAANMAFAQVENATMAPEANTAFIQGTNTAFGQGQGDETEAKCTATVSFGDSPISRTFTCHCTRRTACLTAGMASLQAALSYIFD